MVCLRTYRSSSSLGPQKTRVRVWSPPKDRKIFLGSSFVIFALVLFWCLLTNGVAYAFSEKGSCKKCHSLTTEEAFNILNEAMPGLKILKIIDAPSKGLWEVDFESQGRKGLVYIDYTKRFIFAGSILDIQKKQNLTEARFSELNRVDISKINLKNALLFGEKNAKYKVIVFDDPD